LAWLFDILEARRAGTKIKPSPDQNLLRSSVGPKNPVRLYLKKAAHAALDGAAYRKFRGRAGLKFGHGPTGL
jgi:hypothetical protein